MSSRLQAEKGDSLKAGLRAGEECVSVCSPAFRRPKRSTHMPIRIIRDMNHSLRSLFSLKIIFRFSSMRGQKIKV